MVMERTADSRVDVMSVRVEPMRRRHLRGVLRIEQAVNPRPWSASLFLSELRYKESRVYLVALTEQTIVGYAGLMLVEGDGHITNIGVDPAHHRRGVATRLMLALVRRGIAEGAENLTLEVRASNTGAHELYRRFGFAPAGVRKDYYVRPGTIGVAPAGPEREDALVMWANDIDTPEYRSRLFALDQIHPTEDR